MREATAEPCVVFLGFEMKGSNTGSASNNCNRATFVPHTPAVGSVVISTHAKIDTVVCSGLCLGRMEFAHGELELGPAFLAMRDELLVLLLLGLSGLKQHSHQAYQWTSARHKSLRPYSTIDSGTLECRP